MPAHKPRKRNRTDRRRLLVECLEDRRMLTADWRNPLVSLDVSADGSLAPIDALLVISELNNPTVSGRGGLLPSKLSVPSNQFSYMDVSGDGYVAPIDALQVINALNNEEKLPIKLREGDVFATEREITIGVGAAAGSRTYRFDIDAEFDRTDATATLKDALAVYLVSETDRNATLLDQGRLGTALLVLRENAVDLAPGTVKFDGRTVEIDTSSIATSGFGKLIFQVMNNDSDQGTSFVITPTSNDLDQRGSVSPRFPSNSLPGLGPSVTTAGWLSPTDVQVDIENPSFNPLSGKFTAELAVQSLARNYSRNMVVSFPDLPDGVTLSGTAHNDTNGVFYVNLSTVIRSGGLEPGVPSPRFLIEVNNPRNIPLILHPRVLSPGTNNPPTLAAIGTITASPGGVVDVPLVTGDIDGDPVDVHLRLSETLPTMQLESGHLLVRPKPGEEGTYTFQLVVSDGVLEITRDVDLNVVTDPIARTRVSGVIRGTNNAPLGNVRIEVGNQNALTMSDGTFTVDLGAGPITADTIKVRGELLAPANTYPFIAEKLLFTLGHSVYANVNNVIERPIFLPVLDLAHATKIETSKDTTVTTSAIPNASVFVAAGTLVDQQSAPFTGNLSITEVPIGLTPVALPPNLHPDLVVTIQPGEMSFSRPAPLALPNRSGYPAGTQMELWSINPTTGAFDNVGTGQVSADGSTIQTISGGIKNSSWHFFAPFAIAPKNETKPPECSCEDTTHTESDSGLYSGSHIISQSLATYESQGVTRGVTLVYNSQQAHPVSTVAFSYDVTTASLPISLLNSKPRVMASVAVSHGAVTLTGFAAGSTGGSADDQRFWSAENIVSGGKIGASLPIDLSAQPTGIYDYSLSTGFSRVSGNAFSGSTTTLTGSLVNVNSSDSPFGAGWGIAGVQQITPLSGSQNPDFLNAILLTDGGGGRLVFKSTNPTGLAFSSPPEDFSTLEKLASGGYKRTFPDGTVDLFDASGRQSSSTDRLGNATRFEYDGSGLLRRIVDPVGLFIQLDYANGRLSTITNPGGIATSLAYSNGNLISVHDPDGATHGWEYNSQHLVTAQISPRGYRTSSQYDEHGLYTGSTLPDGSKLKFRASIANQLAGFDGTRSLANPTDIRVLTSVSKAAQVVRENGSVESFSLDDAGRLVSHSLPDGVTETWTRNSHELVTQHKDTAGGVHSYTYDASGYRLTESTRFEAPSDVDDPSALTKMFPGASFPILTVADDPQHTGGTSTGLAPTNPVGDLDGDNRLDVVTADSRNNRVVILYGSAEEGFSSPIYLNLPSGSSFPVAVAIADLNNDQRLDIVTANSGSANATVFLSNGTEGFNPGVTYNVGTTPFFVATGDVSGDGRPDVVVVNRGDATISIFVSSSNGTLTPSGTLPVGANPRLVTIEDIDHNGHSDIIAASDGTNGVGTVSIVLDNGNATFSSAVPYTVGDTPSGLALIDVNDDDNVDVVTTNFASKDVVIRLGVGDGTFLSSISIPLGIKPKSLAVANLDGDTRADLVVIGFPFTSSGNSFTLDNDQLVSLTNDGHGSYSVVHRLTLGGNTLFGKGSQSATIADVSGDGFLDAVVNNLEANKVQVFYGDASGSFEVSGTYKLPVPRNFVLADFDNDGHLDVAASNKWATGNANGDFSTLASLPSGSLSTLAAGDLDGDGDPDLVRSDDGVFEQVLVNANGQFTARPRFDVFPGSEFGRAIALADVDGDDKLDLLELSNLGNVRIERGDGNDGFSHLSTVQFGYNVTQLFSFMVVGDLDDDGNIDLVVPSGDKVNVAYGNGQGGFTTPVAYDIDVSTYDTDLAIGDLNGDGVKDIGVANGDASILFSLGRRTYAPVTHIFIDGSCNGVAIGDVNGDGIADLVAAAKDVTVLIGDGTGSFPTRSHFFTGDSPRHVAIGDVNGDGGADLIVGNSNSVNVLLNANVAHSEALRTTSYDPTFHAPLILTDERNHTTTNIVDPVNGNITTVARPEGQTLEFQYTSTGLLDTATDALGHVTDYDYDTLGRLTSVTFAKGTPDEGTVRYEYDDAGNITAKIDESLNRTEYHYDKLNRLAQTIDAHLHATSYTYDASGNLERIQDANGVVTANTYDSRDRLTKTQIGVESTTYTYDELGNLTSVSNSLGHVTRYRYNKRSQLVETIDPDGGRTAYSYDSAGNMTAVTDPVGNRTVFAYDSRSQLIRETDPLGKSTRYSYDLAGNLVRKTDRNGRTTQFEYDGLNRLSSETWVNGNNVLQSQYDVANNLLSVTDSRSTLHFTYDARDRLETVDNRGAMAGGTPDSPRVVLDYAYDSVGNVVAIADSIDGVPGAITAYHYNSLNQLDVLTQSGIGVADKRVEFQYNSLGQYEDIKRYGNLIATGGAIETTYSYDAMNRLDVMRHKRPDGSTISFFDLDFDSASRISKITDIDGATNYGYDDRDELTSAEHADANNPDETYSYDANGNRISSHLATKYVTDKGNRLSSDGKYLYLYDNEGNQTERIDLESGNVREFSWDYRNRLTSVTDKDSHGITTQVVRFSYDGLNRRISKSVDVTPNDSVAATVTYFAYDREDVILDFIDADGAVGPQVTQIAQRYLHGPAVDQVLAQDDLHGSTQWLLTDQVGTIRDLVSGTGTVVHRDFDTFGSLLNGADAASRYGLMGREFDRELGLYYFRARYYSPEIGRFLSEDPAGFVDGPNRFGFVLNRPQASTDPTGMWIDTALDVASILYDLYRIARDNVFRDCGNLSDNLQDLAWDVVGAATPFVSGLGAARRAGRGLGIAEEARHVVPNTMRGVPTNLGPVGSKAPKQVTPGIRELEGHHINDRGISQPWRSHYDEHGRLIGRTDYNAGNRAAGIPDVHHHTYQWGPGMAPMETGSHVPGEFTQ